MRDRIPLLRYVVVALGLIVLGRLAWDPRIMGADVGTLPDLQLAAARLRRAGRRLPCRRPHPASASGEDLAVRICDALGVLFAGLLVFFQIRHALNGGDPLANTSGHVEQGLFALMSLGFAYVLMRLDLGRANPVFRFASLAFGVLSAVFIVFGLGVVENPLLNSDRILGAPVFSSLMLAYLLPGLAAVLLARASRGVRPALVRRRRRRARHAAAVRLRDAGGAPRLPGRASSRCAAAPARPRCGPTRRPGWRSAWCSWPTAIVRGSREARLASAALVVLSVIKVFLYDLTGITGLWRALSVICLGAVLIGIGLVYQKLIFARRPV